MTNVEKVLIDGFRWVCFGNERGRRTVIAAEDDHPIDMYTGDIAIMTDGRITQQVEDMIWQKCHVTIEVISGVES